MEPASSPTHPLVLLLALGCYLANTYVTIVHPDAVSVIFAVTLHGVIGEVTFCHFEVGVDDHL